MAFVFGLIHGFGFARVPADLGLPQDALLLALIAFNLGVNSVSSRSSVCFCRLRGRYDGPGAIASAPWLWARWW